MHMLWLADNTVPAGNQIANTSVETGFASIVPILWANTDSGPNAGRSFKIEAYGTLSTAASTPGTISFKFKLGSAVLHATVPAIQLPAGVANAGWTIKGYLQIATTGTSVSGVTNAATPSGTTLNFASTLAGVVAGMLVKDSTAPSVIPAGTTVTSTTSTTVTLSQAVSGTGAGVGDTIVFSSGKVMFQAEGFINKAETGANQGTPIMFDLINPGTGIAGMIGVNTQSAANLSMAAQFSVASAANVVTLTQLVCEEIG